MALSGPRDDSLRSVGRRRLAGAEPPDEDPKKGELRRPSPRRGAFRRGGAGRGYERRVGRAGEGRGPSQGWVRGQAARQGESDCAERAECSGPAVRSPFISGLCVRYNLPGCQGSTSISHPPPHPRPPLTDSITNCHHLPSLPASPSASLRPHGGVRLSGQASERHALSVAVTRKYICVIL